MLRQLNVREKQVLQALIDHYITTAKPVGSRTIELRYNLGISAATIRNTMADLEELGLITHLHTSAGRIPTDQGYRVYVDSLIKPEKLSPIEQNRIKSAMKTENHALGSILEQTSRVLAYISDQLGVTIAPRFEAGILTRITMVPVAEKKVLIVIAMKSGLVRSIVIEVRSELAPEMIDKTASLLTERLSGCSLGEVRSTIRERLHGLSEGDPILLDVFLDSCEEILSERFAEEIHFDGTANLAKYPEFSTVSQLSRVIGMVEDRTYLARLISFGGMSDGTNITIGRELESDPMRSMSLVSSPYRAGKQQGVLGVIGPTRMPYSKLVSVVDFTARLLSKMLSK